MLSLVLMLSAITGASKQAVPPYLWSLDEKSELTPEEEADAIDYVRTGGDDIFGLAATALAHGKTQASIDALNEFVDSPSAFRALSATSALIKRGQVGRFDDLRARLFSSDETELFRRELSRNLDSLDEDPRAMLKVYVELLNSDDIWLRYNAARNLARHGAPVERLEYRQPTSRARRLKVERWLSGLPADWKPDGSYIGKTVCGVGIHLSYSSGRPVVERVNSGFPAANAGLQAGAIILAIDDDPADQKLPFELMHEILGDCGTKVRLKIRQPAQGGARELELTREPLRFPIDSKSGEP